ncbi:MAG: hypothetical protein IKY21_00065 [Clostridia bacterium]|nr:hypothetical protein [Clostridia bacterium]
MSSAFKNFFITFAICLLVFAFVGFTFVYDWLLDVLNFSDMNETSETVSNDVSGETSEEQSEAVVPDTGIDENGDVFTAFVMCVDSEGKMLNGVFIDSNGKSKQFIYCPVSANLKTTNEIGVNVPLYDLFTTLSPDEIAQCVSTLTGISTDYCLRFDREGLKSIVKSIPGAYVELGSTETVTVVNPIYSTYVPEDGMPYPEDYYITIQNNPDGKVLLNELVGNRTALEWLLEYNPNFNGAEYNALYTKIAKSIIRQFLTQENAMKSTEIMAMLIANCETNLTLDRASEHLDTIFSYNTFKRHEINYPSNWEQAVDRLRELDGSFK